MLDLQAQVPRVLLLRELGREWRLLPMVRYKACQQLARIDLLPAHYACRQMGCLAEGQLGTWTAAVVDQLQVVDVPRIRAGAGRSEDFSRSAAERLAKKYSVEALGPACNEMEGQSECIRQERYPLRGFHTVAYMACLPVHAAALRSWAQLRLQNAVAVLGVCACVL